MKLKRILALVFTVLAVFFIVACDNEETTAPHVHVFGEWETIKDASCEEKGEQKRTCSCGAEEKNDIQPNGHTEVIDKAVEATCTETGLTEGKHCSVCNAVIVKQETVAAKGHTEVVDKAVAPSCTETGLTEGKHCSVCNTVLVKQETIVATGHTEVVDKAVAPSCTETGLTEGKHCSVCDTVLVKQETVAAKGHTEVVDKAIAPSCTETGLTEGKHCSVCDTVLVKQETVTMLPHTEVIDKAVEPTCSAEGKTEGKHCSVCNKILIAQETLKAKEYSPNEIFELASNSVGEIITYDRSGSELSLGTVFVYSADGKIITNYHVIDNAYSAKITINGTTYNVTHILSYDKNIDIAILKINADNLSPLQICKENHIVGKSVFAIGSSKGLTSTFSQGIITYNSREIDGVKYVQHDAAISNGNSGGPLINSYGEIIGINTWTVRDSQNLNFAISVSELDNLTYSSPLTFSEFYEKECDTFTKIKNHIMSNGTFDASDNDYTLTLGYSYSSDYSTKYTRKIRYNANTGKIAFDFFIDSQYLVAIYMDEIDGVYSWTYTDYQGYAMSGTLYAETFTANHLLGYSYNNISYSSLRTTVRKLASAMAIKLCQNMTNDLSPIGVTAKDLGFLNF